MRRPSLRLAIAILVGGVALDAHALTVLTVGKTAVFRRRGDVASAVVRFGRDAAFATVTARDLQ